MSHQHRVYRQDGSWWVQVHHDDETRTVTTRRYAALVASALVLAPMVRVVSYLWAWIAHLAGDTGHPTGWYPAVMHLPLLALVVLIALLTRAARAEGVTR